MIEGLVATGKTTVGRALAESLREAVWLATISPALEPVLDGVDRYCEVETRLHFWLALHYSLRDRIDPLLAEGRDVVMDSYFFRPLAVLGPALGADRVPDVDWETARRPDLAIHLRLDESERRRRMKRRDGARPKSRWHEFAERNVDATLARYQEFEADGLLVPFDTTGREVTEVVSDLREQMPTLSA